MRTIALWCSEPEGVTTPRYATTESYVNALASAAKSRGFTHLIVGVNNLPLYARAVRKYGLRLYLALIPGYYYVQDLSLWKPIMAELPAFIGSWGLGEFAKASGVAGLVHGLVVCDDMTCDFPEFASFRAALLKAAPGLQQIASIGCAYNEAPRWYIDSLTPPRPIVAAGRYPLWREGVINADGTINEKIIIDYVTAGLAPLAPCDAVVWQGFGMAWDVKDVNGDTKWHYAPRPKIDLARWMKMAEDKGVDRHIFWPTIYRGFPGSPFYGLLNHDKLDAGSTIIQALAPWAADIRNFALAG